MNRGTSGLASILTFNLTFFLPVVMALCVVTFLAACDAESALTDEPEIAEPPVAIIQPTAAPPSAGPGDLIGIDGVTVEALARAGFPDKISGMYRIQLDGTSGTTVTNVKDSEDVVVAKLTFEPDGFVGWHTHPGPAVVAVSQGALTIVNESDCVPRLYDTGQAFVDPGQGNVHVAVNDGEDAAIVYVTFVDIPPDKGPTELLDEPGDCQW